MIIGWLVTIVFAVLSGGLYVAMNPVTPPARPSAFKVQEICRIIFAACVFAIFLGLCFGQHDIIARTVR